MSAKSKSSLSGTPNAKASPATPRSSRGVARPSGDSISSLQNGRLSIDRSPGSLTPKPKVERASPKPSTPTDRKPTRMVRPSSELQAELNQAQEDLKKANEKLVSVEKEKVKALDEVKEAHRLCNEANEKLEEALQAQRRAEENSEIEKFRALEMEQVGFGANPMKEDEWQKELEAVRSQHAVDVAALLSATQELQKVKQELAMTSAAKNQALNHADDATKIAEIHAEKVELLSAEVIRLKSALESRVEMQAVENNQLVSSLELEIHSLRQELERAKFFEEKLSGKEAAMEQLNVDLEASKMSEYYAHNLVRELHQRVEELTSQAEQASESEKSASESLGTVVKKLEESNDLLHDAKSEIAVLKEKLGLLETSSKRQKGELEESEHCLERAREDSSELVKKVEVLESELETTREMRSIALNNEKIAAASLEVLLEEKSKLLNELETSRDEEEKSKKALESLASALHEVSSEARDAKEKLILSQAQNEIYEREMEFLKLSLKSTNEKYESILDDTRKQIDALTCSVEMSRHECGNLKAELEQKELDLTNSVKKSEEEKSDMENEISRLIDSVEQSKHDYGTLKAELEQKDLDLVNSVRKSEEVKSHMENEMSSLIKSLEQLKHDYDSLKAEYEQKEGDMVNSVKQSEEENISMKNEVSRLLNLLKLAEEESSATREDRDRLSKSFNEADSEAIYLKQVLDEAKEESVRLKECVNEMEHRLRRILAENEDLRRREAASQEKVEELSKSLEEALGKQEEEESGDLTDCEKDYDMLPKVVEFSEQNGTGDVRREPKEPPIKEKQADDEVENSNGKLKDGEKSAEVDLKMWESCKIDVKELSPEREMEQESFEDELEPKGEGGDLYDHANGVLSSENNGSPPSKSSSQKKKKALLQKFGSLLKKKGSSNHK
ncbi:WEB family protein At5g16730, chloroplastic [Salvia miltiorrhiza]|uniref:WEB family protein At5g16730, chloroplastic n=1 Tax=Salvia miltiorrhiza TaxID=226208 RepID=UPI0025AD0ED5|nr:WEB family protein At5g16730, chloroplastic [Salvia miltiorrhiza]